MAFREDAKIVEEIVRARDPSFASVDPDRISTGLSEMHAAARGTDADRFLLAAMRLAALAGNGHTRVIPNGGIAVLPLRFVALGRSVYLTEGPEGFRDCRLDCVNGVPVDTLFERAAPWLAGSAARRRAIGPVLCAWPAALDALGAWEKGGRLSYALTDPEGRERVLEGDLSRLRPASSLYPAREHGRLAPDAEAGTWAQCLPMGNGAWHLRFPDFYSTEPEVLQRALDDAAEVALSRPERALVIDVRGNRGGNFLKTIPFLDRMERGWRGGRCAILVDKFTFSAAIVFVALVRDRFEGARIVGEEMGDRAEFWAEGGLFPLPQSGADFRYSTEWHDWNTGRAAPSTPPEIARHLVAAGPLRPDVEVGVTAREMRLGHDPQLRAAVAAVGGSA